MLRSLDPATDCLQPKSKVLVPVGDEMKRFSKDELESIDHELEEDGKLRVTRAVRDRMENAVRKTVLEEMESGGKKVGR
jgi:hypothetical protein